MDFPKKTSTFSLCQYPLNLFMKDILKKMAPAAVSVVREELLPADYFLMNEARKRRLVAHGADMIFAENNVLISRSPESFASTSMVLHHSHADCDCVKEATSFWESHVTEMAADKAIVHLAGSQIPQATAEYLSDAEGTISSLRPYDIGVNDLSFVGCSSKAIDDLLQHFYPRSFGLESCLFSRDGQEVEEIIVNHIYKDVDQIRINCLDGYPVNIVQAYLKSFETNPVGLRELVIQFPSQGLPRDTFRGMDCKLLNNFQHRFSLLIRSNADSNRHVFLRGALEDAGLFLLEFSRVKDCEDLLHKVFGSFYENITDSECLGLSSFTPPQLKDLFESSWNSS